MRLKRQTKFLVIFLAVTPLLSTSCVYAYDNEYTIFKNDKIDTKTNLNASIDSKPVIPIILSPKKQTEQGIPPLGIVCNSGFKLTFKKSDDSPACVKPSDIGELINRGWAASQDWQNFD